MDSLCNIPIFTRNIIVQKCGIFKKNHAMCVTS
jgi:hypothetical protein